MPMLIQTLHQLKHNKSAFAEICQDKFGYILSYALQWCHNLNVRSRVASNGSVEINTELKRSWFNLR
jgi:hypothetical protein